MKPAELRGLLFVAIAVALFATSPVLIRYAQPLTPFEITFWRMVIAAASVAGLARVTGVSVMPSRGEWRRFAGYGLITALHFLLYIASLSFTSIAHSLSLVYTAPIFVALCSALFLREPLPRAKYLGILITIAGVAVLAGFEPRMSLTMAFGDLLALGSAIMFGLYSVAGRSERSNHHLLKYAFTVYAAAALWMAPFAAFSLSAGYTLQTVAAVVVLGVFPLAIGHTLYNAALRRVPATYVNLVATQEVTGGVLLGYLLLAEVPGPSALLGGAITLLGVAFVLCWPGRKVTPLRHRAPQG